MILTPEEDPFKRLIKRSRLHRHKLSATDSATLHDVNDMLRI